MRWKQGIKMWIQGKQTSIETQNVDAMRQYQNEKLYGVTKIWERAFKMWSNVEDT